MGEPVSEARTTSEQTRKPFGRMAGKAKERLMTRRSTTAQRRQSVILLMYHHGRMSSEELNQVLELNDDTQSMTDRLVKQSRIRSTDVPRLPAPPPLAHRCRQ